MEYKEIKSPVVYNFFKRPSVSMEVFSVIREVKPKYLYLYSDGPRNSEEEIQIHKNRLLIDQMIDWKCEVHRYYSDINLGMDKLMAITFREVFSNHDRMIFLEEDILATRSFFYFCDELLEKYKKDNSVYLIGGMNFLEKYPDFSDQDPSYFFTERVSTWGMALWKRTYELIQYDLSFVDNPYNNAALRSNFIHKNKIKYYQHLMLKKNNPEIIPFDGEFILRGLNQNILYNSVAITPARNLVQNIGDTSGAENGDELKMYPKSMRKIALMRKFEIEFPLRHPEFKIIDYNYGKLLSKSAPKFYIYPFIKLERAIRILIFGGPNRFKYKFKRFLIRVLKYERSKRKYK